MAASTIAAISAGYGISESERGKKKVKKLAKKEEKIGRRDAKLKGMKDIAARDRMRLAEEEASKGGSGARSTALTGGRSNTLG